MPMKETTNTPERIDIFGTKFSAVDLDSATKFLTENTFDEPGYVCFPSTGTISVAYKNPSFQNVLNGTILTLIDGKFTEFYIRLKGHKDAKNVSGYWLMENLLLTEATHYFYGCDYKTLEKLEENLMSRFPDAKILGFKAPPVVELSNICFNEQIIKDFDEINALSPDCIWIGISTPKQDFLMHHYKKHLKKGILLGVGAVFRYHAGVESKSPEIVKRFGLRWLFRLFKNPKRIWERRVFNNLLYFLWLIIKHDVFCFKNAKN